MILSREKSRTTKLVSKSKNKRKLAKVSELRILTFSCKMQEIQLKIVHARAFL